MFGLGRSGRGHGYADHGDDEGDDQGDEGVTTTAMVVCAAAMVVCV